MSDQETAEFDNFVLTNVHGEPVTEDGSEVAVGWNCNMKSKARLSLALIEASTLGQRAFWQMVNEANGRAPEATFAWYSQISAMLSYVVMDERIRNALLQARIEVIDKHQEPELIDLMGISEPTWHNWFDSALLQVGCYGEIDSDKWHLFKTDPVCRKLEWERARATQILGDAINHNSHAPPVDYADGNE